jgi:phospholipase/lecithinase/hemolysin
MYGKDPIHAVFSRGAASGNELWEYAVAGSESDHLAIQIGVYEGRRELGLQDKATLFSLEIGGNDIVNNDDLLAAHAPGEDSSADEVMDNIIRNIRNGWKRLRSSHPEAQFVIWTITDTTRAPRLRNSLTREEASNIRAHTQRANAYIRSLGQNAPVLVFDLYAVARRLIAKPPELFGQPLVPPPDYGEYDCLVADKLHPTAVSNAILANSIIAGMNRKWDDRIPRYTNAKLANLAHISR